MYTRDVRCARLYPRLRTVDRKAVKWVGVSATVLLAVIWIGSGWKHVMWRIDQDRYVEIRAGRVTYVDISDVFETFIELWEPDSFELDWGFAFRPFNCVSVPLWLPTLAGLALTALTLHRDFTWHRSLPFECSSCGYDLTGLATNTVCSECGTPRDPPRRDRRSILSNSA